MTPELSAREPAPDFPASDVPAPGGTPAVIELIDVDKVYALGELEVPALRGVSLRIDEGEFVAIVGPSGSGKSTLMHILGCLDVPTRGVFRLGGHDVESFDEDMLARVRNLFIGFVFQQFNLLAYLPAWRNVELPLVYGGVDPAERRERALRALERVGLADRAEHRPGELSGGQQQRVAVARALVTEPAMILADEPTGNLDSHSTADVLGLLQELHGEGRTIVLITHERDIAARAERTIQLHDGRVWDRLTGSRGRAGVDLREPTR
jgi:ABC-type lipoprotein export system ATPase subunit